MSQGKNLPSLKELTLVPEQAFKQDQLNVLLNHEPPREWVKAHPMFAGVLYIPIDKVEFLLTRIFQEWRVEVIKYEQLFQSVSVHVRVHYKNPITGEWNFHDGLGAVAVQTEKGASAADLSKIKSDAVMKSLPAAKSFAIKDAAEHLGKLFGKDLNRRDSIEFNTNTAEYMKPEPLKKEELTPNHPKWDAAKKSLLNGYSVADIKSKYELSAENEALLIENTTTDVQNPV